MNEQRRLSEKFWEYESDFLQAVAHDRRIDEKAFEAIHSEVEALSYNLKDIEFVPKTALKQIFRIIQTAKAEAEHRDGRETRLIEMADQLGFLFGLILANLTPDERRSGVPRVL